MECKKVHNLYCRSKPTVWDGDTFLTAQTLAKAVVPSPLRGMETKSHTFLGGQEDEF